MRLFSHPTYRYTPLVCSLPQTKVCLQVKFSYSRRVYGLSEVVPSTVCLQAYEVFVPRPSKLTGSSDCKVSFNKATDPLETERGWILKKGL